MDTSGIRAVDSLSANEFRVEVNGQAASGIFGVHGLTVRAIDPNTGEPLRRPLVISKMVQQDPSLPFNAWVRETLAKPGGKVTRQLAVVAVDEGVETLRWVLSEAWISDIAYSDFDTSRSELIEERLTIQHGGVQAIWPES